MEDIASKWHVFYGYLAYLPDRTRLTKAYCDKDNSDHLGIRIKTFVPKEKGFPSLLEGSRYTIQEIKNVAYSKVPLCWNYAVSQYPKEYRNCPGGLHDEHGVENDIAASIIEEEDDSACLFTQETVELSARDNPLLFYNSRPQHGKLLRRRF